jgi:hypothetical protein
MLNLGSQIVMMFTQPSIAQSGDESRRPFRRHVAKHLLAATVSPHDLDRRADADGG